VNIPTARGFAAGAPDQLLQQILILIDGHDVYSPLLSGVATTC
jgi:hypothetical protein